eukprot:CAMPEP_0119268676 /NCGR_PEP_ID=MMETSP1329-20130426/6381_1 /TAXON_ID=114041 /ORGANISM="Genus nov. species nov., Strain RCC1024" /LENGTH=40 /DNA_ID= /DNA_START= /DNA_END= /DNA_ORIENTATION=
MSEWQTVRSKKRRGKKPITECCAHDHSHGHAEPAEPDGWA